MAILFIDGFDQYRSTAGAVTFGNLWTTVDTVSWATGGVTGGYIGITYGAGVNEGPTRNLDAPVSTFGAGFHCYLSAAPQSVVAGIAIVYSNAGAELFSLTVSTGGLLQARLGGKSGTILATSASPPTFAVFNHYEIKLVNNGGASSTYEVRLNGTTVLSGTMTLSTDFGRIRLGSKPTGGGTYPSVFFDNFFIWDQTGTANNDFLGERNIYTLMPSADTVDADWVLSSGTVGFDLLNDRPASDANYVESTAVLDTSTFALENLPSLDIVVVAVQTTFRGMKTGTADTTVAVGPAGFTGTAQGLLQDTSTRKFSIFEQNPATAAGWLPAEIDALEIQIRRVT